MAATTTKTATPRKRTAKAAQPASSSVRRFKIQMENAGDTKNYAKWVPAAGNGCVGSIYVPLGTKMVHVFIEGEGDEPMEEMTE